MGLKPHNIVGDNFVLYFQVVSSSCVGFTELIESEPYIRSLIYICLLSHNYWFWIVLGAG